jgi:hypothetical protein
MVGDYIATGGTMASPQIRSSDKLEFLAHLTSLARHAPAGSELQLRCLDLAAEVILQAALRETSSLEMAV